LPQNLWEGSFTVPQSGQVSAWDIAMSILGYRFRVDRLFPIALNYLGLA
jgi:hypothetical protein